MSEVIRTAMAENGLFAEDVPNVFRIQDVFGTSRSYCSRCHRVWSSHISWVKFDLRSQRVLKNWRQRCLRCQDEVSPFITAEELERMVVLAIQRCQQLIEGTFRPRAHCRNTAPHSTTTCEKCKYGRRPCWIAKQKPGTPNETERSYSADRLLNNMTTEHFHNLTSTMASLSLGSGASSPNDSPPFSPAVSPPMVPSPRPPRQDLGVHGSVPFPMLPNGGAAPAYYAYPMYPTFNGMAPVPTIDYIRY